MYYRDITEEELQYFHGLTVPNFTITLTDLLESDLFKVENIKENLYKIYPLFYTGEITTNNPSDVVIDDQVIICQKQAEKETFLTFISNPDSDVIDYLSYVTYYDIGDSLTENEYNSIVSLLRHNIINEDEINMLRDTDGDYGNYLFSVDGCTVLDTGLVVNDETRSAEPKVMLTDNVFHYSTYTLKLEVLHFTGVNIMDGDSGDYRVVDTLEIELFKDQWVTIPLDDLEDNYIISLDAVVDIRHDKPEIHMIEGLSVNGEPDIIQTGDNAEVYAQLIDYGGYPYNINDASGKTVYFFERLTPTFTLTATPNPIESGDTTDIYSTVKDTDGSVAKNTKVYFYQKFGEIPTALSVTADKSILSYADGEKAVLTATLTGETVEGKTVTFKQGDTVLATETTDSNGEATYEYTSTGAGDVTITVECMSLQETYSLEDCSYYSTTEYKQNTSGITLDIALPSTFQLEFDIKPTSRSTSGYGSGCYLRIGADSNSGVWAGQLTSAGKHGLMPKPSGTTQYCTSNTVLSEDNHITVVFDGTTVTYTCNGESVSVSASNLSKINGVVPTANNGLKYIKIKPMV